MLLAPISAASSTLVEYYYRVMHCLSLIKAFSFKVTSQSIILPGPSDPGHPAISRLVLVIGLIKHMQLQATGQRGPGLVTGN